MDAKSVFVIAAALALGLPYLTVALVRGGSFGFTAVGSLFLLVVLLVVWSDIRGDEADDPVAERADE